MPLPERVAGSDLIFDLCARAAERGFRLFLLGGATGIAEEAARRLCRRYPKLHIVGIESPPFLVPPPPRSTPCWWPGSARRGPISYSSHLASPRASSGSPITFRRLVSPSASRLVHRSISSPAKFAGPHAVLQRLGLEWAYRMWREPRRLGPRYARNARFLLGMVARDLFRGVGLRISEFASSAIPRAPGLHYKPRT